MIQLLQEEVSPVKGMLFVFWNQLGRGVFYHDFLVFFFFLPVQLLYILFCPLIWICTVKLFTEFSFSTKFFNDL